MLFRSHVPTSIVWGTADVISTSTLDRWSQLLPHAQVVRCERVGHFVSDEAPELVVAALEPFLREAGGGV